LNKYIFLSKKDPTRINLGPTYYH